MKKRKLRKWVKIVLIIIVVKALISIIDITLDNYKNDLNKCDSKKGYTCNVFGK